MASISTGSAMSIQQIIDLRSQIINRSDALQNIHAPDAAASVATGPTQGFDATLKAMLGSINAAQTKAETVSAAYQRGEVTDVAQVMLARQEAGVAFEATLQVRNKLLSAYQDIMRMGV